MYGWFKPPLTAFLSFLILNLSYKYGNMYKILIWKGLNKKGIPDKVKRKNKYTYKDRKKNKC